MFSRSDIICLAWSLLAAEIIIERSDVKLTLRNWFKTPFILESIALRSRGGLLLNFFKIDFLVVSDRGE